MVVVVAVLSMALCWSFDTPAYSTEYAKENEVLFVLYDLRVLRRLAGGSTVLESAGGVDSADAGLGLSSTKTSKSSSSSSTMASDGLFPLPLPEVPPLVDCLLSAGDSSVSMTVALGWSTFPCNTKPFGDSFSSS